LKNSFFVREFSFYETEDILRAFGFILMRQNQHQLDDFTRRPQPEVSIERDNPNKISKS